MNPYHIVTETCLQRGYNIEWQSNIDFEKTGLHSDTPSVDLFYEKQMSNSNFLVLFKIVSLIFFLKN